MSGDSDAFRETTVDPRRMEVFIESMTPPGPDHLRALEEEALEQGVPIIRPQTQNLLRFFCRMLQPSRILEVGTATGFSALFMQHYAAPGCQILTIERDPERAVQARDNFAGYGSGGRRTEAGSDSDGHREGIPLRTDGISLRTDGIPLRTDEIFRQEGGNIRLLEGDAARILPSIREDASFDLIFMDAAKGQYIRFLPDVLRLLRVGGILITDNILQEGDILASRFAVTRRNRTIHSRMRAYLRALAEEPSLETLLLPTGDGSTVCLKKQI